LALLYNVAKVGLALKDVWFLDLLFRTKKGRINNAHLVVRSSP